MAERVDLDWAEGYLTGRTTNGLGQPLGIDATLAMAAELRVAREVAEADRWLSESATPERIMRLNRATAAYREWCEQHSEAAP